MDISDVADKIVDIQHTCDCIVSNINFDASEFVPIRHASDGMDVWIVLGYGNIFDSPHDALRCKVACAAGNNARVVNEHHRIDKWMQVGSLYVPSQHLVSKIMDD